MARRLTRSWGWMRSTSSWLQRACGGTGLYVEARQAGAAFLIMPPCVGCGMRVGRRGSAAARRVPRAVWRSARQPRTWARPRRVQAFVLPVPVRLGERAGGARARASSAASGQARGSALQPSCAPRRWSSRAASASVLLGAGGRGLPGQVRPSPGLGVRLPLRTAV